jgi:hypothetical protein
MNGKLMLILGSHPNGALGNAHEAPPAIKPHPYTFYVGVQALEKLPQLLRYARDSVSPSESTSLACESSLLVASS